jgi:hypothetical protein
MSYHRLDLRTFGGNEQVSGRIVEAALERAPQREEASTEISPAADAAMKKLKELFSDPAMAARASFRCAPKGRLTSMS